MVVDAITEEIRAVRHKLAAQFDNDVSRIFADVREKEASDGRVYISLPKRPARPKIVPVERPDASDSDGRVNG